MIPVPPGPSDIRPAPEPIGPIGRGSEPIPPLVLAAFDEIDGLKKLVAELRKRLEAIEHRLSGIAAIEQRLAALEAGGS
jgi:hypothetical protein